MASCFLSWTIQPFQIGSILKGNMGANPFVSDLTSYEIESKKENKRAAFPESVPIYLNK